MKLLTHYLSKSIALFALVAVLQSCDLMQEKPGIWKDDKIAESKRKDFHELNDKLLKSLKDNTPDQTDFLLSKDLLENNYHKRVVELITNQMKLSDFALDKEYYVVSKLKHGNFIQQNADSAGIAYTPIAKEMYIAFFLPKNGSDKKLLTVVYGKFDYGWKIDKLEFEPYIANGKTSAQLYKLAQDQYAKGYLVDAINNMALGRNCDRPSEELPSPQNREMGILYGKMINEANEKYKFPFVLTEIPTKPKILRILNQAIPQGTFPAIYYLSSISIKDTVAIKKENENVKKIIGKVIPGIDKDKDYLIYYVYDKKPSAESNSYSFDIIDKLR
ncbi:hypothetical protein [Mucilaginibacter agri]|uniref:Uncharacterized protein n=1 Tax=Mucilaginibacter agri TaxID=2695265 RepID=A0A965ZJI9_9SPHI|nr:hypothetical protein [Mucilaginibacter agri]NCD72319.1 hypothetical protein [Mucilaginibacter agri]